MPEPEEVVECNCPIPLKPMGEWVKAKNQEGCKPCVVGPVVQWYHTELKERGYPQIAERLEQLAEGIEEEKEEQIVALCNELDKIKEEVSPSARERLKDFDCEVQALDVGELAQEVQVEALPASSPPLDHNSNI